MLSEASSLANGFGADLVDSTRARVGSNAADAHGLGELTQNGGTVDGPILFREGLAEILGVAVHHVRQPREVDFDAVFLGLGCSAFLGLS